LDNSSVFNTSIQSNVLTNNYINRSSGSINGTGTSPGAVGNYPQITITGNSENDGSVNGYINIHDITLVTTDANSGFGFDVITGTTTIGSNVVFAIKSNGFTKDIGNCDWIENGSVAASGSSKFDVPVCPYNGTVQLFAQANIVPYTNVIQPLVTNVYYTWQPGNIQSQNPVIPTPTVTTIYTVTANYGGCLYTHTVQITVDSTPFPSISYISPAPFLDTSPATTLTVNQTGGTFSSWVYHIALTNSLVTIDAAGKVIAHGNCFGTYTVTLCPPSPPSSVCGMACVTTTISLQNLYCPFDKTVPIALCPGDKIQFKPLGGITGSYFWTPAPTTLTAGLTCTTCQSPTLIFDGTPNQYTVTSYRGDQACGSTVYTVTLKKDCQKDDIIGCCFSNYGAAVWVGNATTYLNVYCNLVNELGYNSAATVPIGNGKFQNINGSVRVLLDWIHNGKNMLYVYTLPAALQGTTSLFGADQKIRGNSSNGFNELWLEGSGTKSMWINQYGYSVLDLTSNILDMQDFVYAIKNPTTTVRRTSGYTNNGLNGYFSRTMSAGQTINPDHLFPLGAKANAAQAFRYRPLVITNNSATNDDEISANLMNIAPAFADPAFVNAPTATLISNQAPNVLQINHAYYHRMKNTPVPANPWISNVTVKAYYVPSDGQFQSLSEWEKDPAQAMRWWGSTPGSSASNLPSADPGTPNMIYAQARGTLNFNHEPFALARGGFYLNTSSFGNNNANNNTVITVTASPSGGSAPTPTGGGLTNPFGTGASSGNSGNGNPTVFTPNPVAGDYVMNISSSNNCAIGGKIKFTIDQNGNILPDGVLYGLSSASAGSVLGRLSPDVYTIDNINTGISFSATPRSLLNSCVNSITVTTTSGNDFIITPGENILVSVPNASIPTTSIVYGLFKLFNSAGMQVLSPGATITGGTTNTVSISSLFLPAGVYSFELPVSASATPFITETLKGQIIIK
jgi:hypothetical protein